MCFSVVLLLKYSFAGGKGLVHFVFALSKIFDQKKTSYFFYGQYKIAKKGLLLVLKKEKKQLLLYKITLRHK